MSDETSKPSSKSTGCSILDNPQVYDLLMSTIGRQVAVSVRERNENLRNWFIGILTIAVIILTAGGALTLKLYVDQVLGESLDPAVAEAVDPAVAKAVDPAVAKAVDPAVAKAVDIAVAKVVEPAVAKAVDIAVAKVVGVAQFESEVAALNFRILSLDRSEGFTPDEAESIIRTIQSLVSKGGEQRLKLVFAVDTAVKNFASANRLDLVVRLEDVAPDLFQNSGVVIQTMLQARGFRLLGDAGAPASWMDTIGSRHEIYKNYRMYADRAEIAGYPELYLLFEMLLGYVEGRPMDVINNLIEDADSLSEEDAEYFVQFMGRLAIGEIPVASEAEKQRIFSRVTAFLCKYRERGTLLRLVSHSANLQC